MTLSLDTPRQVESQDHQALRATRSLADQAFSRAAGAPLVTEPGWDALLFIADSNFFGRTNRSELLPVMDMLATVHAINACMNTFRSFRKAGTNGVD